MNNNIQKFYDFISIYNLLIKHCSTKNNTYEINVFHSGNKLHIKFLEKETNKYIYNDNIPCNNQEALMITNTIANEFVLNHQITLSSFKNVDIEDVNEYYWYNEKINLKNIGNSYYNENNQKLLVYELKNNKFILRIHFYNGVNPIIEEIHHIALNKINSNNKTHTMIKVKQI